MLTFNSCTKCSDIIHDRTSDFHPECSTCVIDVLGLFVTCYPLVFYDQALLDIRSSGAGIKRLYCR